MKFSVQRKINNLEKSRFHLESLNNKILKINKNQPFHPSSSTRRLPSLLSSLPPSVSVEVPGFSISEVTVVSGRWWCITEVLACWRFWLIVFIQINHFNLGFIFTMKCLQVVYPAVRRDRNACSEWNRPLPAENNQEIEIICPFSKLFIRLTSFQVKCDVCWLSSLFRTSGFLHPIPTLRRGGKGGKRKRKKYFLQISNFLYIEDQIFPILWPLYLQSDDRRLVFFFLISSLFLHFPPSPCLSVNTGGHFL